MGEKRRRKIGFLLFEGFELLDVFGPAEMFGIPKKRFGVEMIAPAAGAVASFQGPKVVAERALAQATDLDVVFVPGGMGTRTLVDDADVLAGLRTLAERCELMCSVCTGSGVLARAGVLDGCRATSNKAAFPWAVSQGPNVDWVKQARWVEHGKFWTSSGVTAGIGHGPRHH